MGRYRLRVAGCNSHGSGSAQVASVIVTAPPVPASHVNDGSDLWVANSYLKQF
ncbi:MAG: hypothetical protein P8Y45_11930 [Exilibacterium sp.]